jgi:hypothetical protein
VEDVPSRTWPARTSSVGGEELLGEDDQRRRGAAPARRRTSRGGGRARVASARVLPTGGDE